MKPPITVGSFAAHESIFLVKDICASPLNIFLRLAVAIFLIWVSVNAAVSEFMSFFLEVSSCFYLVSAVYSAVTLVDRQKFLYWVTSGTHLYQYAHKAKRLRQKLKHYQIDPSYFNQLYSANLAFLFVSDSNLYHRASALTTRLAEMTLQQRKTLRSLSSRVFIIRTTVYPAIIGSLISFFVIPNNNPIYHGSLIVLAVLLGLLSYKCETAYRSFIEKDATLFKHSDQIPYIRFITGVRPVM